MDGVNVYNFNTNISNTLFRWTILDDEIPTEMQTFNQKLFNYNSISKFTHN